MKRRRCEADPLLCIEEQKKHTYCREIVRFQRSAVRWTSVPFRCLWFLSQNNILGWFGYCACAIFFLYFLLFYFCHNSSTTGLWLPYPKMCNGLPQLGANGTWEVSPLLCFFFLWLVFWKKKRKTWLLEVGRAVNYCEEKVLGANLKHFPYRCERASWGNPKSLFTSFKGTENLALSSCQILLILWSLLLLYRSVKPLVLALSEEEKKTWEVAVFYLN